MEKAILFFDIDGTILSEKTNKIPESAVVALKQAQQNGHMLFINTGRTMCSIPPELKRFTFDGYLCGCGIYLTYKDEVLFEKHLPVEIGEAIAKKARQCKVGVIYEGAEDIYFSGRISRFDRLENTRRYFANRGLGIERYIEQGGCEFDKLFVYADEVSDRDGFFKYISDYMEVLAREDGAYECILKGYSKGTAIAHILEKFGMSKEDAYVFGDSSNDLSMFEYAIHTVAMGAHDPILDPHAEFATKAVEEDGIEFALQHYGLI